MRRVHRSMAVASISALALLASACGGDGGGDDEGEGASGGSITVRGCNPENPLVPINTSETCGGNILDVTTAKLIHYATEDAAPENDIAESIETTDNQNFTVKIKEGYKFSDGTEVKAKNFVDSWNYAAFGPNGMAGAYFMSAFEGVGDLACDPEGTAGENEDPCKKVPPKAETMSGLKVVDDYTFTIKTSEKVSNLPVRLGYTAFAPLPDSFFEDPEAFAAAPVSAGPYMVESQTPNKEVVLVKNPEYSGDFAGNVDKITFKMYTDPNAAYQDLVAGNIDVSDDIPTDVLTDDRWIDELGGNGASREEGVIQTMTVNLNVPGNEALQDPEVRKAISMAIDRETITKEIYAGTRSPADGWVSPVVDGYKEGQCGEFCVYDPEAAKQKLDAAGGFKGQKITIASNTDSDHGPWIEAACNSIRQALDIECTLQGYPTFDEYRTLIGDRKVAGWFRTGWQMDYPSIENFLGPIFGAAAAASGSNDADYNNPEFEKLLTEAAAAEDAEEANGLYQQAEALLAEDMINIPLWYSTSQVGWSDKVNDVTTNAFGVPDYAGITLK